MLYSVGQRSLIAIFDVRSENAALAVGRAL
jgi:hypothetical protein